MDQQQQAANRAAAGGPGTISLGGTDYKVAHPGRAEFVTLQKKLRSLWKERHANPIKGVVDELAGIPKEYHAALLEAAVKAKPSTEPTNEALSALLYEVDGCRFWTWLLIDKATPGLLSQQKVAELITADNVDQVLADLLDAGGLKDAADALGDEGKN